MSFDCIKTLSFDATGTLFDPLPSIGAIYAEILQRYDVLLPEPELEMRFLSHFHKSRAAPLDTINESRERQRWEEVVRGILEDQYQEDIFEAIWQAMGQGKRWKPKARLTRTLQRLTDSGFRLAILSNWDKRLYGILEDLQLESYFDRVFISTEIGLEKPSVDMFHKVAEELNTAPSLLHIGNSPANDYKPAIRAGWNALLLHNRIPHGMEPGTVLGSIDQLPEVLKSEQAIN